MYQKFILYYFFLKNILLFKYHKITLGRKLRIRGSLKVIIKKEGKLKIGSNFNLTSGFMYNPLGRNIKSMIRVDEKAEIIIGDNVGMSNVSLWSKKSIIIGNNVKIGADVLIFDSDMHALDYKLRREPNLDTNNAISKPIVISDDVFIGTRCIVSKGVIIGARSIIASGSVITKSIPCDEIWGGNPVRFIKKSI